MAIGPGLCETIPSTIYPARLGLPPVATDEIRLEAGGTGWMGTFGNALRFIVADVLSGDEGFEATVQVNHHRDAIDLLRGKVVSIDPECITFEDGVEVELDDVLSITL